MLLSELLRDVDFENFRGTEGIEIDMVAYNSKHIKPGGLFVAIRGFQADGHDYVPQAVQAGARAVVVERSVDVPPHVATVQVRNGRQALARLAANWYAEPSQKLTLYGVTGTNGKTTTTWMIRSILAHAGRVTGLIGTTGYFIQDRMVPSRHTTPESLDLQQLLSDMYTHGVQDVVMEVSSHALKLHRVDAIRFAGAVFTAMGRDHLDFHPTLDDYLQSKLRLFDNLTENGCAIINHAVLTEFNLSLPAVHAFGSQSDLPIHYRNVRLTAAGSYFDLHLPPAHQPACVIPIFVPIPGRFNIDNAVAAASVLWLQGYTPDVIKNGLADLPQVPGRFERVEIERPFAVIVDFAHTPDALENVLQTAREFTENRLWVVLGAGGDRDRGKRPEMGRIAANYADRVVLTSDNPRTEDPLIILKDIQAGIGGTPFDTIADRRAAIRHALSQAQAGDTILIAGKGHESYQEIHGVRYPFSDQDVVREFFNITGASA